MKGKTEFLIHLCCDLFKKWNSKSSKANLFRANFTINEGLCQTKKCISETISHIFFQLV